MTEIVVEFCEKCGFPLQNDEFVVCDSCHNENTTPRTFGEKLIERVKNIHDFYKSK